MIYPRLWLSRNLLKDDGVIFVSIDDDEVANLRKVMDEIYGEENFVGQLVWKKKYIGGKHANHFVDLHEYILVYSKNIFDLQELLMERPSAELKKFILEDEYVNTRGRYYIRPLKSNLGERKTLVYPIKLPDKSIITTQWMVAKKTFNELITDGRIVFKQKRDGSYNVYRKYYMYDGQGKVKVPTLIDTVSNADAKVELKKLFNIQEGRDIPFDNPKPTELIKYFLSPTTTENDIILDFFAGSGTTAHAVMDLNAEDGGTRKYILVQLPEATDEKSEAYKAGYKKISDITKERIKRVIKKLDYQDGFKSYYLDNSNFQMFKELKKRPNDSLETIEKMLKMSVFQENILTQGAKELDLVYEVGLKNGFTLSAKTQTLQSGIYNFTKLYENEREFYFCFDKEIQNDIINAVPKEIKLICYEKALGDSVKLNLHSNLDLETL